MARDNGGDKTLELWIWDAACSIRGAKDAPKYKDFILPLIFAKRLSTFETLNLFRVLALRLSATRAIRRAFS